MLIYEKTNTQVPLTLSLSQEGVGGLTSETPTVALRNALDPPPGPYNYLDFADGSFKDTGHTTKYQTLSHVERGHYLYQVNLNILADVVVGSVLVAEYQFDNGSGLVGIDNETILVVESIVNIPTETAALITGVLTPDQEQQLLDIWRVLGLDPSNPLVISETQRRAGTPAVLEQNIECDVPLPDQVTVTRIP